MRPNTPQAQCARTQPKLNAPEHTPGPMCPNTSQAQCARARPRLNAPEYECAITSGVTHPECTITFGGDTFRVYSNIWRRNIPNAQSHLEVAHPECTIAFGSDTSRMYNHIWRRHIPNVQPHLKLTHPECTVTFAKRHHQKIKEFLCEIAAAKTSKKYIVCKISTTNRAKHVLKQKIHKQVNKLTRF